jgi:hypothetical protein
MNTSTVLIVASGSVAFGSLVERNGDAPDWGKFNDSVRTVGFPLSIFVFLLSPFSSLQLANPIRRDMQVKSTVFQFIFINTN